MLPVTGRGRAALAYLGISLVFAVLVALQILRAGPAGFYFLPGPASQLPVLFRFLVLVIAWALFGAILLVTRFPEFAARHAVFLVAFSLLAFSYLTLIREPNKVEAGDFRAYFRAAEDIHAGRAILQEADRLYLYPPLLATLVSYSVPFGLAAAAQAFHLANYFALLLFLVLLYLSLIRCGIPREVSALLVLVSLVANATVVHNLVFHQINLAVADAMLLSLLLYPASPLWSAACLALGVHLKVYPVFLVVPFLLRRDWRWCAGFSITALAVAAGTSWLNSFDYYRQFFQALGSLPETGFRNSSIDAFVFNTLRVLHLPSGWGERGLIWLIKGAVLVFFLRGARWTARALPGLNSPVPVVDSAFVVLSVAMLLVSPTVWPHHLILVIFPALVLVPLLNDPVESWIWGASFAVLWLMPISEVYPFPYLRLAGLLLLAALIVRIFREPARVPQPWVSELSSAVQRLVPAK